MDLFDLFARIFLDSSEYDKGLDESKKKTESFGSKVKKGLTNSLKVGAAAVTAVATSAIALGGAMVKATGEVAAHGDEIDKMSQKLGLSYTSYQEWDYILGQAGVEITNMSTGLKTLTNKLDDAKNGGEDAQGMFEKLGLSMEDLSNMSREDVFSAVISGFQQMEDSTERAALANDLFGKSGQELTPLFNSSIEDTNALREAAHELGFVMGDESVKNAAAYQDALDTLQRSFGGLKTRLTSEFMPSITTVMDGLAALVSGDSSGLGKVKEGIKQFASKLSDVLPEIIRVGSEIIVSLGTAITENLPILLPAAFDAIRTIGEGILSNLPMILETGLQMILTLAQGLIDALPEMIPTIVEVVLQIVDMLTQPDTLSALIDASIAIMMALANGLIAAIPRLLEKAPEIVGNLMTAIVQNAPKLLKSSWELMQTLARGIFQNLGLMLQKGGEIVQKVVSGIGQSIDGLWSAGLDIVKGIWKGISDGFGWIKERISGWVGDLLGFFKRILKIGSPSKVFRDQVGKFMAQGIGQGFVDEMGNVERMMQDAMPAVSGLFDTDYPMEVTSVDYLPDGLSGRGADGRLMEEILGLLRDIRDNMDTDLVLSDGTLIGWMDKALGRRAMQRARGNA